MLKLPEQVQAVGRILSKDPSDDCFEIAQKLIVETPELVAMWKSLERHSDCWDDFWVWGFLKAALRASTLPPFHYIPARERRELSERIGKLSRELSRLLKQNELDCHLIYNDGRIFDGFLIFEDFGESNQSGLTSKGCKKLPISRILEFTAERAQGIIKKEPLRGKAGKKVKAVRFVRLMAKSNHWRFKTPLNQVIATASNAIFATKYSESDISKILSR